MSVACDMATHMAAPTITAETMAAESGTPRATNNSRVTPMRVMPLKGDQLVRPMHSLRITPATQIHRVPTSAIAPPWTKPISSLE